MIRDLATVFFSLAAGFTVSGIAAELYRLIMGKKNEPKSHMAVMIVAGPNMLLQSAAGSLRARSCSAASFWLAAAVSAYWSFVLGLFVLNVALAL
jgi:hypothetical protein